MDVKSDLVFEYDSIFKYESVIPISKKLNPKNYKSPFDYHSINIEYLPGNGKESDYDESYVSSYLRKFITTIFYILTILTFPLSAWICIKKVHALERLVLMRLGKLQSVKGPGFAFILPMIDQWTRVNLKPQSFTVSSQVLTADGGILDVMCDIDYQVSDIINYVMKLSEQEKTIKDLGSFCVKNVISEKDLEDLENKTDLISSVLKDELNKSLINWGFEVLNVNLYSLKVIKAAEPVDAVGALMAALNATFQETSSPSDAIPVLSGINTEIVASAANPCQLVHADIISSVKKTIVDKKGLLNKLTATIKINIIAFNAVTLYCSIKNGEISISTNPSSEAENVSLTVTEEDLRDVLSGKLSLVQAYKEGKAVVTGDWNLLRPLSKLFDQSSQ